MEVVENRMEIGTERKRGKGSRGEKGTRSAPCYFVHELVNEALE